MAIVNGVIQAKGSVKGMSFYSVTGSDQVIMRTKGGATKNRIAVGAEFVNLRKHQVEWSGCVEFARSVRNAVDELYRLADYNLSPVWTGMGKKLIKLDKSGETGERAVRLTSYKQALEGFSFNKKYPLNSILSVPPQFEINRELLMAKVSFPRINTEMDLNNFKQLPYFRLLICLGGVSDIVHQPEGIKSYQSENEALKGVGFTTVSDWYPSKSILETHSMEVQFDEACKAAMSNQMTLLLTIGLEFGNIAFGGNIEGVKYAGCAKIVCVG